MATTPARSNAISRWRAACRKLLDARREIADAARELLLTHQYQPFTEEDFVGDNEPFTMQKLLRAEAVTREMDAVLNFENNSAILYEVAL